MDSVEVTLDVVMKEDGPGWRISIQSFIPEEGGMVGESIFTGDGPSIAEPRFMTIEAALADQFHWLVSRWLGVHCLEHEVGYCRECGTARWARGPFD
jgi:hypothetical protein